MVAVSAEASVVSFARLGHGRFKPRPVGDQTGAETRQMELGDRLVLLHSEGILVLTPFCRFLLLAC